MQAFRFVASHFSSRRNCAKGIFMKIEHIGFCVKEPISIGHWYAENLGLRIIRELGDNSDGVVFLRDNSSGSIIEFGRIKDVEPFVPQYSNPIQIHIAFECDDPYKTALLLQTKGGILVGESQRAEAKNERYIVKDPWGYTIQLINRINRL